MESQENVSFSIIYDDLYIVIKYLKRYIKSIIMDHAPKRHQSFTRS